MSSSAASKSLADAPRWQFVPRAAGILTALTGVVVIIGWYAHWIWAIQILPDLPVMQFNTALALVFCGLGLYLLTCGRFRLAAVFGGTVVILGLLTWLEYLAHGNLGIDQLFIKPYVSTATTYPGRMSPLSAACFLLVGAGLIFPGWRPGWAPRLAWSGLLACIAQSVSLMVLFGYLLGIDTATGWGAYSRMAIHTAAIFLLMATGLLIWSWQSARAGQFNFIRWAPLVGSATLMLMIGIVSAASLSEMQDAMFFRTNDYRILNVASSLAGNLGNIQRGMRGYILTGDPVALQIYAAGTNNAPHQLGVLTSLAGLNHRQARRVEHINTDVARVIAYSAQLLETNRVNGLAAVVRMEKSGDGLKVMNRALSDLNGFTQDEQDFLNTRDQALQSNYNNIWRLLELGGVLAAGLLITANWLTGLEARRRARAEAMQHALNARLAETSALQNAILRSANYAIITTNTDGLVTTFNSTAERLLGYAAAEVVGLKTPALWHEPAESVARALMLSAELGRRVEPGFEAFVAKARLGGVDENEWTYIRKDGTRIPVSLSVTALTSDSGQIVGFLGVIGDITERKRAEDKLRASEERFRLLIEEVKDYAIFGLDADGSVASWNAGAQRLEGYTADEIIGRHIAIFHPPESVADHKPERELAEARAKGHVFDEGWRVRKDGSRFYASVLLTALHGEDGKLRGFSKVTRDITESWRAEESLRLSEERFRSAFDGAPIGMALVSPEGRWLKVNRALCGMIGYSETELLQIDFQRITHPEDLEKDLDLVRQVLAGRILSYQLEKRYFHKHGAIVNIMLNVSLVRDRDGEPLYFVAQIENITERKQAAEKIAASLREKEALLREIHHRVKNNMQVISSILQLQSGYLKDPADLEVFRECQGRIRSMALIHEKLYRSEGLANVDFKEYLQSLVSLLFRSHAPKEVALRHEFDFQPLALDADTAIPLGLIANELVSNSLKHAFTGRTSGFVRVILKKYGDHGLQLIVQDDGKGLPPGFNPDETGTLGVRLVKILSSQIKSQLEFNSGAGAEFVITLNHGVVSYAK